MEKEILVPELGETISSAEVVNIFFKSGEEVFKEEIILELETDKVTLEITAPEDGKIGQINCKIGDLVKTGDVLFIFKAGKISKKRQEKIETKEDTLNINKGQDFGKTNTNVGDLFFEKSVLDFLKDAVLNRIPVGQDFFENKDREAKENEEKIRFSPIRRTIATNLKKSQNTLVTATTYNEIDMTKVLKLRAETNKTLEKQGVKLGITSFFAKAVASALAKFPEINAEVVGENILYKNHYDIGIAMALPKGLVVPVIFGVNNLNLVKIEQKIKALLQKAQNKTLSLEDMQGATFTITNGGVFGSMLSSPVINYPQSAILGLHSIKKRAVVEQKTGAIEAKDIMYVALSYDHRIIDGKGAVSFLMDIKNTLETLENFDVGVL